MANEVSVITNYDAIPDAVYDQALAYIRQLMGEKFPDRSFATGRTFYWNVIVPNALAAAGHNVNVQTLIDSLYLASIRSNPQAANPELVDLTLQNYFVSRRDGAFARGTVAVIVNQLKNYAVTAGTVFTFDEQEYENLETIYVYTLPGQIQAANDRLLVERSDGRWQFTVPIVAKVIGVGQFLPVGSLLTMQEATESVEAVTAITDITGGAEEETTAELIDRIPSSLAAQTFAGENHTRAMIINEFPGTRVSLTGMGDAELHRDRNNITGISAGGMVDIWCATSLTTSTVSETFTATLVNKTQRQWEAQIPADIVSGVYGAIRVVTPNTIVNHTIVRQERGFSIPSIVNPPRLFTGLDAAFSQHQTVKVVFQDVSQVYTSLNNGDTADYTFVLLTMPLITEIADYLVNGKRTDLVTNVLVRGAAICVVDISLTIRLLDGDYAGAIDVGAMRTAIAQKVYSLGFDYGVLSSSHIMDAVHNYINGRSDVSANSTAFTGSILAPTGETLFVSGDRELRIPNLPDKQVTVKTCVFLTDVSRIHITFERVEI